jgi:hypothetical protein
MALDFSVRQMMGMTKEELVEKIKKLLRTDDDLNFLLQLKMDELKTLISRIRDRTDWIERG